MGMKSNSGFFSGTQGGMKFKLNIQHFASKVFSKTDHVSFESLKQHGSDLLDKSPSQIKSMMQEVGYDAKIEPSKFQNSTAQKVVTLNPSKDRNITQIQVSLNGSQHHGNTPYIKVSTKDIGIVKIVNGPESSYKAGKNEKAKIIFKGGKKK